MNNVIGGIASIGVGVLRMFVLREIIHTSTLPKRAFRDADAEEHDVVGSGGGGGGTTGLRAGAGVVAIISALRAGTRHRTTSY